MRLISQQPSTKGTGIRLIPKQPRACNQVHVKNASDSIAWSEATRNFYQGAPFDVADEFESCVALFTMIRENIQWTKSTTEDALSTLFLLCVIITDRGYLSAQILDILSHANNTSYIATRIGYIKLPLKGEILQKCCQHALQEMELLRKAYFKDSIDLNIRAKKLPDRFFYFPDGLFSRYKPNSELYPASPR